MLNMTDDQILETLRAHAEIEKEAFAIGHALSDAGLPGPDAVVCGFSIGRDLLAIRFRDCHRYEWEIRTPRSLLTATAEARRDWVTEECARRRAQAVRSAFDRSALEHLARERDDRALASGLRASRSDAARAA